MAFRKPLELGLDGGETRGLDLDQKIIPQDIKHITIDRKLKAVFRYEDSLSLTLFNASALFFM